MLDAIFQGTDGLDALENGFAVRSDDFEQVYMIAAVLVGPALDGQVGIWASNRLDGTGLIFAVDGFAQQFSDWGDADKTDANITINNDGVEEAKDCATA